MSNFFYKPIDSHTDVSRFDCGNPELNDFLVSDALKNQDDWLSSTILLMDETGYLLGFFTITPDTLHKGRIDISDKIYEYPYLKYPAIKLARLAVDRNHQREGIGSEIMTEFFVHAFHVVQEEGGRFITVDAKSSAVKFYRRYGFKPLMDKKSEDIIPMYLDFKKYYEVIQRVSKKDNHM